MSWLAEGQRAFAAALLDPALGVPSGLVGPDGEPCPKRFAVYRNNVFVRLIDALRTNFPVVSRLVGDEFFHAMARAYVVAGRRASPIMWAYGEGFPDFIVAFEPAASLPYLPDVARIERAWSQAYHADEATALEADALASVSRDRVPAIHFRVHPSVRVVRSRWPALTIWRMHVGEGAPSAVDLESGGEDTLIARPAAEVEVYSLPAGAAALVSALAEGRSLARAARAALAEDARFDFTAALRALVEAGCFVGYET